jgi:hypothetical protein
VLHARDKEISMNYLKLSGCTTIVAMALVALTGVGTGSATVLCKNNTNYLKCSEPYPAGTEFTSTLISSSLTFEIPGGGGVIDTCTGSTTKETLVNAGSSTTTVTGSVAVSGLTWSGCTLPTKTLSGGETELHWIPSTEYFNGTITAKGMEVTIGSGAGSCVYATGKLMKHWGVSFGGVTELLLIGPQLNKVSGSLCPSEVTLVGIYRKTEPKVVYVTSG